MTTLAASPVDEFDMLSLIADRDPSFAERFRLACKADADAHRGVVDPNRVRASMLAELKVDEFEYRDAKQYAGLWSQAAGRNGYLDVPDRKNTVPISGPGSKRNGAKEIPLRVWRGWSA